MSKKIIYLLLALAIAAALVVCAKLVTGDPVEIASDAAVTEENAAEEAAADLLSEEEDAVFEAAELTGVITEVTDDYVMLDAGETGMVQANISDDTLIEGVDALEAGQTAVIMYDGKMTRSLPAQITALHIGVYPVSGTVTGLGEGSVTIVRSGTGDEVVLTLPDSVEALAVGDTITAYTTGISTMSLPPQMNAIAVVH